MALTRAGVLTTVTATPTGTMRANFARVVWNLQLVLAKALAVVPSATEDTMGEREIGESQWLIRIVNVLIQINSFRFDPTHLNLK